MGTAGNSRGFQKGIELREWRPGRALLDVEPCLVAEGIQEGFPGVFHFQIANSFSADNSQSDIRSIEEGEFEILQLLGADVVGDDLGPILLPCLFKKMGKVGYD